MLIIRDLKKFIQKVSDNNIKKRIIKRIKNLPDKITTVQRIKNKSSINITNTNSNHSKTNHFKTNLIINNPINKKIIKKSSLIISAYLILCMCICPLYNAFAADTSIVLDSTANGFVCIEEDTQFLDMEPAESREAKIKITNNSNALMDFYINGEVIDNIADNTDLLKCAIYKVQLYKDNEELPFFEGIIGSGEYRQYATENNMGNIFLAQDTKFATLNNNESSVIRMVVTLDGRSFNNSYMDKSGKLRLNIGVAQDTINETQPDNTDTNVQTGDNKNMQLYIGIIIICLCIICADFVIILMRKRKLKTSQCNDSNRKETAD